MARRGSLVEHLWRADDEMVDVGVDAGGYLRQMLAPAHTGIEPSVTMSFNPCPAYLYSDLRMLLEEAA